MARWRVTAKHYIYAEQYGQPTEWERQETNQDTGRMFRKLYKVPLFIDPDDPKCQNRHEGFCVVSRQEGSHPGDIIFDGKPTMDMEPLDDEARAESDAERPNWIDPINSLPLQIGEEAGKTILRGLEQQIASIGLQGVNASLRNMPNPEIEAMKAMLAEQQKMINQLLSKAAAPAPIEDPPVEPDIPLPDIDPNAAPKPPPIRVDRPRNSLRR